MDCPTFARPAAYAGWTEAEIHSLVLEHGILLRMLARLQQQLAQQQAMAPRAGPTARTQVAPAPRVPR